MFVFVTLDESSDISLQEWLIFVSRDLHRQEHKNPPSEEAKYRFGDEAEVSYLSPGSTLLIFLHLTDYS